VKSKVPVSVCPLLVLTVLLMCGAAGCGYQDAKRDLQKAHRVLGDPERSVEDLSSVRGRLRRIIDLKIQAVNRLEEVNRALGHQYLIAESFNLAREVLEEAEYLKPYSAYVKKDLGECYYFLGTSTLDEQEKERHFERSLAYYNKALEIRPDLTEAHYGLGLLLYFAYKDVDGAIEEMKLVLDQDVRDVDARFALGRFYYENGEYSKALGEYLEITRILPKNSPRRIKAEDNILQINREL
jgi:tetratricopeptide (TPR) repeat protein